MAAEDLILKELRELRAEARSAARPILSTDEAAQFTGLTKGHLYKLVSAKRIPHYKSAGGKLTYFKREELVQWLCAVKVPTADELETKAAMRSVTKVGKV